MRTLAARLLVTWISCAAAGASAQEVYTWTDASGTTHFADNPAEAPKGVTVRTLSGEDVSVLPSSPVAKRAATAAPVGDADAGTAQRVLVPRVDPRAVERRWREAFSTAHERVRRLEEAVAAGSKQVEEISGLPVTGRVQCSYAGGRGCMGFADPRWEQQRQKLEQDRASLVEARGALEALEREASEQAVPRGWRR